MTKYNLSREVDLPLEVVILLIAGMAMLITGVVLFPVSSGILPYYENGVYGILLVMFSLQIITLGKTPFGDVKRSKPLLAIGGIFASLGIITSVIPTIPGWIPRMLLFLCLGPGSFVLLLQMYWDKKKYRSWIKYGPDFRPLILACSSVYVLSMVIAMLIWQQSLLTTPMTAVVVCVYGSAIVYLANVLRILYRSYCPLAKPASGDVDLSTEQAMLLLMGIFMLIIGMLLIPVNLGRLPFAGSAQLGLLMVMFAVQMLALGSTPLGPFPRSRLMIATGLLFAALGIISCIVPEILVSPLTILVGVLNILGGGITLLKICLSRLKEQAKQPDTFSNILTKLFVTQLTLNLLSIMFGASMLVSNLIPGLVIGVILAANGGVLLYLLRILLVMDTLKRDAANTGVL
jgi:hypothetical protein